ncbi:5-oxoprolinase subunit PxpB [Fictibacillus fluitans]|uniref:5-oxoprolinase subunit PxpB n=1 Tax=Fictibacillus fluitans TaxID=3058422 RepID=A0ABT8HQW8_9BACL|nr:5-oxoprolinase subunit PxpB [Fictibacillus sp. NE201]MDN4523150.1 5-oxoprolinase subunit PxpB [Fictibacillus sp. NE201]
MFQDIKYLSFGEAGILLEFGSVMDKEINLQIHKTAKWLNDHPFDGFIETVPAYTTLTVLYDPMKFIHFKKSAFELAVEQIRNKLESMPDENSSVGRTIEIPVCYGGDFGPDLENVASINGISPQEVISIHTEKTYYVYMLGFAPGFPFLGGMAKEIAAPRLSSPRLSIPKGSVGIAGEQTGIYPIETPGGWQLIGRTPTKLFTPDQDHPVLLQAGDQVKFYQITPEEYHAWEAEHEHHD